MREKKRKSRLEAFASVKKPKLTNRRRQRKEGRKKKGATKIEILNSASSEKRKGEGA